MPHEFREPHRAKIPEARYPVTNWPDHDRSLLRRGDLRFYVDDAAIKDWTAARRGSVVSVGIPNWRSQLSSPPARSFACRFACWNRTGAACGGNRRHWSDGWRRRRGYGLRSSGEITAGRVKRLNGGHLRAGRVGVERKEAATEVAALRQLTGCESPLAGGHAPAKRNP